MHLSYGYIYKVHILDNLSIRDVFCGGMSLQFTSGLIKSLSALLLVS